MSQIHIGRREQLVYKLEQIIRLKVKYIIIVECILDVFILEVIFVFGVVFDLEIVLVLEVVGIFTAFFVTGIIELINIVGVMLIKN